MTQEPTYISSSGWRQDKLSINKDNKGQYQACPNPQVHHVTKNDMN